MDNSEKITFSFTLLLVIVIIVSSLLIFILTPSPISPTKVFFGYITSVYTKNKSVYLDFDSALWFKDSATDFPASNACHKYKGEKCSGCSLPITKSCVPNGYFIYNQDTKVTSYNVASFSKVGTLLLNPQWDESDPESKPYKTISLSEFQNIFQNPNLSDSWITKAPFDITVIGKKVIIINQHYIP